jgi:hypothetical protein
VTAVPGTNRDLGTQYRPTNNNNLGSGINAALALTSLLLSYESITHFSTGTNIMACTPDQDKMAGRENELTRQLPL